jgi:hypothetical protein
MCYTKPGYIPPIQIITNEEYREVSQKGYESQEKSTEPVNLEAFIKGFNLNSVLDSLKTGMGRLVTYASSPYGHYSGGFQEGEFVYGNFEGIHFKIRVDAKDEVADQIISFAEMIRKSK